MRIFTWRLVSLVAVFGLLLVPAWASADYSWQNAPFSSGLHYDSRHSGFSRLEGPYYPDSEIKWSFTMDGLGRINSSCAVGPCEPYLDANGNGAFDEAEPYQDLNGNGVWDECFIVFTSRGGYLCVLNPDGTLYWYYETNSPMTSTPAIGPGEPYYDDNRNGCYDLAEPFTDQNGNGRWDIAEPFVDANNSGGYDEGEDFTDLNRNHKWDDAEPFVDADGDGLLSPAEPFIDENGNGVRDRCTLYFGCDDGRLYALYGEICEEPYIDTNGNGRYTPGEHFTDWNANGIWDWVRVKWSVTTGGKITSSPVVNLAEPFADSNGDGRYNVGEPYLEVYQDGIWNPGAEEWYSDLNKNGRYDADYPEPYWDTNSNGRRDGVTVCVGSHDGCIYSISEKGNVLWKYPTGSWVTSSPAISLDGAVVYCGSNDHFLYAIYGATGKLQWRKWLNGPVNASPAISRTGVIYIGSGSPDNRLYAFDPNGNELWKRLTGTWVHSSPAIGIYEDVYCGTYYDGIGQEEPVGKLYSVPPDGQGSGFVYTKPLEEGLTLGSWVQSSPIVGAEGSVYIVSGDDTVYSVEPYGQIIARVFLPTGVDDAPDMNDYWIRSMPAIGPNETIYIGCWDGKVYALQKDRTSTSEPDILMAGYMNSVISASHDSILTVQAFVTDPESNVQRVKVYYEGLDLGWELRFKGFDKVSNAMVMSGDFLIPGGALEPLGSYSLELVAEDAVGNLSQTWPYFAVTGDTAPLLPLGLDGASSYYLQDQPISSAPVVLMAGNPYSHVTTQAGGDIYVAALVTDPDGIYDIAEVNWDLYYMGVWSGYDITNHGYTDLYDDAVLYLFKHHVNPGVTPSLFLNRITVVDEDGNVSTSFPAITVVD